MTTEEAKKKVCPHKHSGAIKAGISAAKKGIDTALPIPLLQQHTPKFLSFVDLVFQLKMLVLTDIEMGDIADMILDGTLDEETGEYIGDHNLRKYGKESPGFPVSVERERRERAKKTNCPECGKRVKTTGLAMHKRDVHGT